MKKARKHANMQTKQVLTAYLLVIFFRLKHAMENLEKFGPSGNISGRTWDQKGRSQIVRMWISYDIGRSFLELDAIRFLRFQYVGSSDTNLQTVGDGDSKGQHLRTISLGAPSEYITGVEGTFERNKWVRSITIKTNKGSYGPFGNTTGRTFSYEFGPENQFGGFHGTCDDTGITSLGVYLKT